MGRETLLSRFVDERFDVAFVVAKAVKQAVCVPIERETLMGHHLGGNA
jgi:hypothetical protein